MESWLVWGLRVIQSVQAWSNPVLDAIFKAITFIGDEKFALVIIPFLYWAVDKSLAVRLGYLSLGSAYLNTVLKATFAVPRPPAADVRVLESVGGYSFPSGHAQTAATVWGYLAMQARKAWFWIAALVLISLVGLSRVYLGVHWPHCVIAGIAIGLPLAALYDQLLITYARRIRSRTERGREYRPSLPVKLAVALAVPLALLVLHTEADTVSSMAMLLGLGTGVTLEGEWVRFSTAGPWVKRITRFLAGVVVLMGLYFGLKAALPEGMLFRMVRYTLLGLWGSLGAPWMFLKLRLAERE